MIVRFVDIGGNFDHHSKFSLHGFKSVDFFSLLTLSVPDEGHCRKVMHTKFDIYVFTCNHAPVNFVNEPYLCYLNQFS